jgi:disulfide bond formation protein DsbB
MNQQYKYLSVNYLNIVFFLSLSALLGSLYLSEALGYLPCLLCWYQRILAYPLVLISGVALLRKDYDAYMYILPLSVPGMLIALYNYGLQKVPGLQDVLNCSAANPCSDIQFEVFGFITIPLMSFFFFLTVTLVAAGYWKLKEK